MNTFLPYEDFDQSAEALDTVRLRCQIKEGAQIMQSLAGDKGFPNHPATRMWRGLERSLLRYVDACGMALLNRTGESHRSNILAYEWFEVGKFQTDESSPWWLGIHQFHGSHQSNLRRKDPVHYAKMKPTWAHPSRHGYEYLWPIEHNARGVVRFQIGPQHKKFGNIYITRSGRITCWTS